MKYLFRALNPISIPIPSAIGRLPKRNPERVRGHPTALISSKVKIFQAAYDCGAKASGCDAKPELAKMMLRMLGCVLYASARVKPLGSTRRTKSRSSMLPISAVRASAVLKTASAMDLGLLATAAANARERLRLRLQTHASRRYR